MLSSQLLRLVGRRALSTSVCLQGHASVAVPAFTLPSYTDNRAVPLPAVAFVSQLSSEQQALKAKEQGAWRSLSASEKVELYHIRFNKTYANMKRKSHEWKTVVGGILFFMGFTAFIIIWQKRYVFGDIPHTLSDDWVAMQTRRALDMRAGPIEGLSSKWDYDKNEWKK
ncbi:PREDICTED: cytochrome c oxidase subunit 4 isoform 1, mitochondrial [Nanorana parkeri]|uniref:cytochrome c oxidase subunit 4 isoform 1, mitochondrial n=1 Tax=Nanorana parkeri TaxID=125878 RepID=UPI0008541E70|nr:PREDICTED: cytochrome c oxidase subunit 4 isoform 1, mitochondrial [Nanorana parkeri]